MLHLYIQYTNQGHELAPLHDGGELLSPLAAGADLLTQQVAGGQVGVPVLGHDPVALRPLAAAGPAQYPHDGQLGLAQRGLVDSGPGNLCLMIEYTMTIVKNVISLTHCTVLTV
jgi:hypothetical protein